jgi:hypothetical protein
MANRENRYQSQTKMYSRHGPRTVNYSNYGSCSMQKEEYYIMLNLAVEPKYVYYLISSMCCVSYVLSMFLRTD